MVVADNNNAKRLKVEEEDNNNNPKRLKVDDEAEVEEDDNSDNTSSDDVEDDDSNTSSDDVEDDISDTSSDDEAEVDPQVLLSIQKLREIGHQIKKLNEEETAKAWEMVKKYNEIRKPLYEKRNEIIKNIPDFWLTAFSNHPVVGELLNEEDKKIFKYLYLLEIEEHEDAKSGLKATFHFKPNPYFENTKLEKTYTCLSEEEETTVTATPIKWKEGKGIPNGFRHVMKGNMRFLINDSFFSWFRSADDIVNDDQDGEIAELIKDDIFAHPLAYSKNAKDDDEEHNEDKDK